ncbi:SMP-30/gluconolactonase/LRE family protein [Sphingomonas sp.]|uniref:SMP-30/gluconolactonase/LRE family protein n=1 Tax=Sphingomonas sp. TaxID=28214 RepID=UPI00180EB210|nr:SMP-30/gluconolactonase/LRE family protein [Sphingomonas sp.]MBA3511887.1 SMP-30/gluconolactonase/LRE family protein [Sphingomonas sp.]
MEDESDVICVADVHAVLGEGPVWVSRESALYWLDIKGRKIFRLGRGGEVEQWETPLRVGSLAPRAGGGFIAGTEHGIAQIDLGSGRFDIVDDPEEHLPDNRFNDGKVDRSGRFWAGSMDDTEKEATGTLYRIEPGLSWTAIDEGYKVTNGPAFSPLGELMYHNDSARQVTYVFDLDGEGNADNRRVFATYGEGEGYPDGMTVDAEGCLWIAFWEGWCVRRYSPNAQLLQTIEVPVSRPTSCAFGGSGLDRLYITSASIGLDQAALAVQPQAGGLFVATPGVRGIAEIPFAG